MSEIVPLLTGADARLTPGHGTRAVVCMNGGSGRDVEGDWSATLEWLVQQVVPEVPALTFLEIRYRIKSWRRLEQCMEDGAAAVGLALRNGASAVALLGFSMGGAVAIGLAGHPAVTTVIGLAPWIPDRMDVSGLDGRRIAVIHGGLDAWIPGIPGVSPGHTLRGIERIREREITTSHAIVRGGLHGIAVRAPWGRLVPLPRAGRWKQLVLEELRRFDDPPAGGTAPSPAPLRLASKSGAGTSGPRWDA